VLLLDARLEQIHNNLTKDENSYLYGIDQESSELNFSDSVEQKAKYMHVEELQYQAHVRKNILKGINISQISDEMLTSVDLKAFIRQQDKSARVTNEPVYGFRYGIKYNDLTNTQRS